jgi:Sigma-70 region 2
VADLRQLRGGLALISTHWPLITDPVKFILRYAPAIRGYLQLLLPPPADVDEVLQEFLFSVVKRGFTPDRIRHGRFRNYLIAAVRYRAWRYLRRKLPKPLSADQAESLQAPEEISPEDAQWLVGWRQCLLDRAWEALEFHERRSHGNWHYTVLKLTTDHPDADSVKLAAQVAADPPLSPAAFRKQLSRARAAFAQALIDEIERTLEQPTPEAVSEELADVGLLEYVRPYLKIKGLANQSAESS